MANAERRVRRPISTFVTRASPPPLRGGQIDVSHLPRIALHSPCGGLRFIRCYPAPGPRRGQDSGANDISGSGQVEERDLPHTQPHRFTSLKGSAEVAGGKAQRCPRTGART